MLRTGAERTQRGDAVRERNGCTRERERVICDVMGMTAIGDERAQVHFLMMIAMRYRN